MSDTRKVVEAEPRPRGKPSSASTRHAECPEAESRRLTPGAGSRASEASCARWRCGGGGCGRESLSAPRSLLRTPASLNLGRLRSFRFVEILALARALRTVRPRARCRCSALGFWPVQGGPAAQFGAASGPAARAKGREASRRPAAVGTLRAEPDIGIVPPLPSTTTPSMRGWRAPGPGPKRRLPRFARSRPGQVAGSRQQRLDAAAVSRQS